MLLEGVKEQVLGDQRRGGEGHRVLDHVVQLADVSRPGRLNQHLHGLRGEPLLLALVLGGEQADEVLGQERDVLPPLVQGRQFQADHVQPVEQVLAEGVFLDRLLEVAVGGRNDAHVHRHRLGTAHRPDLPVLEHAQQLDLDVQRHVADLVEEQGAVVGRLEQAGIALDRAGERALDVAEQLGFEQRLRDGGAVDRDERPVAVGAGPVDGDGQQFLAGAALAADEHGGVGLGHQPCPRQQLLHHRAAADDVLPPLAAVLHLADHAAGGLQGLFHLAQQVRALDGLGQEREHALPGRLHRLGDGTMGGDDDHRHRLVLPPQRLEQRQAVDAGHAQVGEHHVRLEGGEGRQGLLAALGRRHLVALALQTQPPQTEQVDLVVYQQYLVSLPRHGHRSLFLMMFSMFFTCSICSCSSLMRA